MEENMTQDQSQAEISNEVITKPDVVKVRSALADGGADFATSDDSFSMSEKTTAAIGANDFEGAQTDEIQKKSVETKSQESESSGLQQNQGQFEPVWQNIQKIYEQQYGEGTFKKPDEITPETEFDTLLAYLHQNLEPNLEGFPDEAREIIELYRQGTYDPDEYLKQKANQTDILKLPAYDFLFNMYRSTQGKSDKNPDGHTEEEIHEFLKGMNKIQLKELADQKKASISVHREQNKVQREQELKKLEETEFMNVQKQKEEKAKKIVNQLGEAVDFFGIEPSHEDRATYNKDFVEMVKLNPQTGTSKLYDLLQDDSMLYKVGYFIWKNENLRGYLTDLKEGVKKNIESKLDPTLEKDKGSTKMRKAVDRGKLY